MRGLYHMNLAKDFLYALSLYDLNLEEGNTYMISIHWHTLVTKLFALSH
ncbi:hypothetical protein Hdeb2414_s0009g00313691 [Helianthus debilis subsp. tardiflorus]